MLCGVADGLDVARIADRLDGVGVPMGDVATAIGLSIRLGESVDFRGEADELMMIVREFVGARGRLEALVAGLRGRVSGGCRTGSDVSDVSDGGAGG